MLSCVHWLKKLIGLDRLEHRHEGGKFRHLFNLGVDRFRMILLSSHGLVPRSLEGK